MFLTSSMFCIRSKALQYDEFHSPLEEDASKLTGSASNAPKLLPDTRMNLSNRVIQSSLHQHIFITLLSGDDAFLKFRNSRTTKEKDAIVKLLSKCDFLRWARMEIAIALTKPFHQAHILCSGSKTPLFCYVLTAQALFNTTRKAIGDSSFDTYLGEGSGKEVMDLLLVRFNMNGGPVSG